MASDEPLKRRKAVDPAPWRESLHAEDFEEHLEYRRVVHFPNGQVNYSVVLTKAEAEDSFSHWAAGKEPDSSHAAVSIESRYVGPWEEEKRQEIVKPGQAAKRPQPIQGSLLA